MYLGSRTGTGEESGASPRLHVRRRSDGWAQHLRCGTAGQRALVRLLFIYITTATNAAATTAIFITTDDHTLQLQHCLKYNDKHYC